MKCHVWIADQVMGPNQMAGYAVGRKKLHDLPDAQAEYVLLREDLARPYKILSRISR